MRSRTMQCLVLLLATLLLIQGCGGKPSPFADGDPSPLAVKVIVTPSSTVLMGRVEVVFDLFATGAVAPELDFTPAGEDFLVERGQPSDQPHGDGIHRHVVHVLRPRRLGELIVPAATVSSGELTRQTAPHPIKVESALVGPDVDPNGVEPPAPPFPATKDLTLWLLLLALLVLVSGVLFFARRRQRTSAAAPAIALPPHVTALRALARLRHAPRSTAEQIDTFYVEVSRILRVYLEQRFGLHAPERTTDEFLGELEGSTVLTDDQRHRLSAFLAQCDLVKFARLLPDEQVHMSTFTVAEEFVEATREDKAATTGGRDA